jgi:antirestriction protein ArdC
MGDEGYALEELVAELAPPFLCADYGSRRKSARTTLKVLKDDKPAVFTAASHASKAVGFQHGLQPRLSGGLAR